MELEQFKRFITILYFSQQNREVRANFLQILKNGNGFNQEMANRFLAKMKLAQAFKTKMPELEKNYHTWKGQGIECIDFTSALYPKRLRNIEDPPLVLFFKGNINIANTEQACAIVGARKATMHALDFAYNLAQALAKVDVKIISGLALGVDGAAHDGAVSGASRSSAAVLGNGLNTVYPSTHRKLSKNMLDTGSCLLSQFLPSEQPLPYNFLNRNRVIAALADKLIVIEAGKKSGSLVTARHALEYGKEIWVVPGDIFTDRYLGSNRLIQEGANVLTSLDDLNLIFPGIEQSQLTKSSSISLSKHEQKILDLLKKEVEIKITDLNFASYDQIMKIVMSLEFKSLLRRVPGNKIAANCKLPKN